MREYGILSGAGRPCLIRGVIQWASHRLAPTLYGGKRATQRVAPVLFASKQTPTPRPPTPIKGEGEKSSMITGVDDIAERGCTRIILPEPRQSRTRVYSL